MVGQDGRTALDATLADRDVSCAAFMAALRRDGFGGAFLYAFQQKGLQGHVSFFPWAFGVWPFEVVL